MCDTVVVVEPGRVFFAKNSDRDPNEGQGLRWLPAAEHPAGSWVRCAEVSVPQARRTHAALLSQPFWLWGAEMGVNEHGVAIGNEAVFTDQPLERPGLTGMCLVRLGLERAATAAEAVEEIGRLVERHGQGGRCGLEDASFSYHSSFLIADPRGAYVLETAGRRWQSERVTGARSISNGLSLEPLASRHGDRLRTGVACAARRAARTAGLAAAGLEAMAAALRDHGGSAWPSYALVNGTLGAPCMHGGGVVASSQTTASWLSELTPEGCRHWATGTSSPCLSLFKPVRVGEPLDLGPAPGQRQDGSFFWEAERLHRRVMGDPAALAPLFLPERDRVEAAWFREPPAPAAAWREHRGLLGEWGRRVEEARPRDRRPPWAQLYWRRRERWATLA